jgi:hypothetical protein
VPREDCTPQARLAWALAFRHRMDMLGNLTDSLVSRPLARLPLSTRPRRTAWALSRASRIASSPSARRPSRCPSASTGHLVTHGSLRLARSASQRLCQLRARAAAAVAARRRLDHRQRTQPRRAALHTREPAHTRRHTAHRRAQRSVAEQVVVPLRHCVAALPTGASMRAGKMRGTRRAHAHPRPRHRSTPTPRRCSTPWAV